MSTKARGRGNAHTRRNLAEFDADAHTIEEVMTYNVIAVNPRTSLREKPRNASVASGLGSPSRE